MILPRGASRATARLVLLALAPATILLATLPVEASATDLRGPDDFAVSVGYGSDVDAFGVAAAWKFARDRAELEENGLDARLVAQLSYWYGRQRPTPNPSVWDVGLMPMLRWTAPGADSPRFFAEGGVGVNLLSSTRINNDRVFSTAFQFGEQGGIGVALGGGDQYELEVFVQHVSNANLKRPNDGLTYAGLLFRAALR